MEQIKYLVIALSLVAFNQLTAQYTDEINTNRPGNSAGAFSVGKNVLQIEGGLYYLSESHSVLNYTANGYGADLTTRYGLLKEQLELSLDLQFQMDQYTDGIFSKNRSGLRQTTLGAKYLFYDPFKKGEKKPNIYSWRANHKYDWKRLIPAVSGYLGVNYTMNNDYVIPDELIFSPKAMLITQHHLDRRWVVVTNFFADKIISKTFNYGYVVTVTYGINEKWSAMLENKGIKGKYYSDGIFTVGATYLLNKNLQLDASISKNIKSSPDLLYGGLGVSWRLDKKHQDPKIKEGKEVKEVKDIKKEERKKSKTSILSEEELDKAAEKAEKQRKKNDKNKIEEVKPVEEKKKRVDDLQESDN
ncbi:transporter [Flavobacterium oreochromis]|uniref:Transporter n=1 Tax=Flavobacterium columnare TaxID=996 RepID=A0A246G9B8_9FLAO|nr:transporter [Flavobacterium oreochromis]OWP76024.1 hypothetical protein BWK62_10730 [Flavobacterium oreochromis]QYS85760.1 transporter [Flavobacterium oreochromis]